MMLVCPACGAVYENAIAGKSCDVCKGQPLAPYTDKADFIVEGMDDQGLPSGRFMVVTEVAVVDEQGRVLGRFTDANTFLAACLPAAAQVVALETKGEPRANLTGRVQCDRLGL